MGPTAIGIYPWPKREGKERKKREAHKRQDEDEHPKLSIKREMYEETGIELDNFEYLLNENGSKIIWKNKNGLPMWVFLNKI